MADRLELEFWYEFASTYSYPAAMRIAALADRAGVAVRWRPFLLAPIFGAQGWTDSPFNIYPTKGRYMWRDLERICNAEGLPLTLPPARFPQNGLKAARLALVGETAGWIADFTRAVYTANFAEQMDISDDAVLAAILEKLGVDVAIAQAAANALDNKEKLKGQTDEAMMRGLFGAPSFTAGHELFWGNDRLEQAIEWVATTSRRRPG
jgi:2-hydroxychromene-2-carboxylate isomerase